MRFDPAAFGRVPLHIAAVALAVGIGNALVTMLVLLALRAAPRSAADVGAALAQIGEFSFILSGTAVARGLMPDDGRDLVLAAAMISLVLQPALFRAAAVLGPGLERLGVPRARPASRSAAPAPKGAGPDGHGVTV